MRCAALQFDVRRGDFAHNTRVATELAVRAADQGARFIALPEMWPSSFPGPETDVARWTSESDDAVRELARVAAERELVFCASSLGPSTCAADDAYPGAPTNRWQLFDGRECVAAYDKVHLFSPTAEHESFSAGDEPPPVTDTRIGRVGGLICYDLRFPELTRRLFDAEAELVGLCAQWPSTRATHFRALVVGLAVANQCFVVAANRCGSEAVGRRALLLDFPGNSLIVDPHGNVLAEGRGETGVISAEIDLDIARELRARVPVARDRRPELYGTWDERDASACVSAGF